MKKSVKISLIYMGCFLIIGIFNMICFSGAETVTEILQTKDTAVELNAVISDYTETTETDADGFESTVWETYVSYIYDGNEYSGVRYDTKHSKPEIGTVVTVRIDSEYPDELLPDKTEVKLSAIISPIFLAATSISIFLLLKSLIDSILEKRETADKTAAKVIPALFVAVKLIAESIVFYNKNNSLVFAVFSAVAVVLIALVILFRKRKQKRKEITEQ